MTPDPQSLAADALARAIAREFRRRVLGEYVPRIRTCVRRLTEEQVWRKPSPHGNSIGNLLLHLEGNMRQWLLAGLGGEPDHRLRAGEFAATATSETRAASELVARLEATATAAARVVDRLTPPDLLAHRRFQQRYDEDGVAAVLHVLEHFSGHAGQIYAWTKQMLGVDLKFYDL